MKHENYYPLSVSQYGIYYECQKDKSLTTYNRPYVMMLPDGIDINRLKAALQSTFKAHPALKTKISIINGEAKQSYDADEPLQIGEHRVSQSAISEIKENYAKPFDVEGENLYRLDIYTTEKGVYLFYDFHHIIIDGTSFMVFYKDLARSFDGEELSAETYSVGEYAEDEAKMLGGDKYLADKAYFDDLLKESSVLSIATKKSEDGIGYVHRYSEYVPSATVLDYCTENRITPNVFFAGAIGLCLSSFSREDNITFCTVHNGRLDPRLREDTGMFVKTLPLAIKTCGEQSVAEYLSGIRLNLKELWKRQTYPFSEIVNEFGLTMEIAYTYQSKMFEFFNMAGERVNIERLNRGRTADNLEIYLVEKEDRFEIRCEYNDALYDEEFIHSLICSIKNISLSMLLSAEVKCADIPLLSTADENKIIRLSRGEKIEYDKSQTIVDMFESQAAKHPDCTAVVFGDKTMTYSELDNESTEIAYRLASLGVKRESVVAVMIDRNELMAIYPMAIMKAGGVYMPLDPSMPAERLSFMLKDAGVKIILTQDELAKNILSDFDGHIYNYDAVKSVSLAKGTTLQKATPDNMYVILYTSGSTGIPKGCMLEHHSLTSFCHSHIKNNSFTDRDSTLAYANFAFDAHMMELYPMFAVGGTVHIISGENKMDLVWVNDYIEKHGITVQFFTTQIGKQFVEDFDNNSLRLMLLGGERLPAVKKPRYDFVNLYGPTECTVYATSYGIKDDYDSNVIGAPVSNYNVYVTDKNMHLLPVGASGELCIGGSGVGRGYLNRNDVTAEKFVMLNGERVYRSGDLVRWNKDGEIEFLGRMDGQVKLRGLRIELGEVESRINAYPDITASVVDVKDIAGVQHLCGYFTAKKQISIDALRNFMGETLTEFMIPTGLMQLDKLPLTSNGKVNRKALPKPEIKESEVVLPKTDIERDIFEIVAELMKNRDFGVTTNLFGAGMTSILAIKLSTLMQTRLSLVVPTKSILKLKTIRLFAAEATKDTADKRVYEKREFYPLTESQKGVYYDCCKNPDALMYNIPLRLKLPASTDAERLKSALEDVINAHTYLKSKMVISDDEPKIKRRDDALPNISLFDAQQSDIENIADNFVKPFDLFGDNLYRIAIYKSSDAVWLFADFHHIIFDGTSMGIFFGDLAKAYNGENLILEPFSAFDKALEDEELRAGGQYKEAEKYFEKYLTGTSMTQLPAISTKTAAENKIIRHISHIDCGCIDSFCRAEGVTESSFFLSVLLQILNRYTREDRIAVTTASGGRSKIELASAIGMFVRTLPVVADITDVCIKDFVKGIQDDFYKTIENEIYPFTEMASRYGISPQVNYAYEGGLAGEIKIEGETVAPRLLSLNTAKFPFAVFLTPETDGYELRLELTGDIYTEPEAVCFADCFKSVAEFMSVNPDSSCTEIIMLSSDAQQRVMKLGSAHVLNYDQKSTVVDLFRKRAANEPDSRAVVFGDTSLTYSQLDLLSDKIAEILVAKGIKREDVVGVMVERNEYMVVYPLAIMKAGAAYMPLDHTMPAERLSFMLKDASVRIILTEGMLVDNTLPDNECEVIKREDIQSIKVDGVVAPIAPSPEDMFVILYTSGSTGVPKGCMLEHRNLVNFCEWYADYASLNGKDKSMAYANFAFDAHMLDIYPILLFGGEVHIISSSNKLDLVWVNDYMERNGITVQFFTTQIGKQFVEDFDNRSLKLLSIGGERLTAIKKPRYKFLNAYGPTECTIFSTIYDIKSFYNSTNIGNAIAGYETYVLDQNLKLLPLGIPGELCIGGRGVGRGYLNRPDVNKEKFIIWNGKRIYRTADQVRMTETGEIEYIGRMDGQIKLRGLRIELGEVESCMASFPGITAAVAAVKEIAGVQHLCGYFKSKENIDIESLRHYMGESLTEFMIPTGIMQLAEFPINQNGKVNRKILPVPQVRAEEKVMPSTQIEKGMFDIASKLLKTDDFGVTTNLFTIGMTSILAIKFSTLLHNKLSLQLPTKDILKLKNIRLFAEKALPVSTEEKHTYAKREYYPLTDSQMGIYLDWEKHRDALQYNVPYALKFNKNTDAKRLRDAVAAVINAHPYLKTTIALKSNGPVQLRRDEAQVVIAMSDTTDRTVNSLFKKFVRPFNILGDNLYRVAIYSTEKAVYLLTDIHHIIYDGTSMGIFADGIKRSFEGENITPETYSAFDEALKQEEDASSELYEKASTYFDKLLSGVSMTQFPVSSSVNWNSGAGRVVVHVDGKSIYSFCKTSGITESNLFLSSLCQVINRYTREEEVAITTVSSGRADTRLSETVGMFVKTLPVVAHIEKQTICDFVQGVQEQLFSTMENEIYPFTEMVGKYGIVPQINYVYEGGMDGSLCIDGERVSPIALGLNTVKFPLALIVSPEKGGYRIVVEYDRSTYSERDMQTLADAYMSATYFMANNKDKNITQISLIRDGGKDDVLKLSAGENLYYNKSMLLIDRFRETAKGYPDITAFVDSCSEITYEEADIRSSALASALRKMGVVANSFVAIMMPRKKEYLLSVLATHKAGGAFVPFDSEYPIDRLLYMLENSNAKVLITERELYEEKRREGDFFAENVLFVDEFDFSTVTSEEIYSPSPEDIAYMIYTSGSTGKPKGVMIRQKSLLAFAAWSSDLVEIKRGDNVSLYPSFSFDASISDIASVLYVGATLHIISSDIRQDMVSLVDYIKSHNIVGGSFPTQFGMEMLNQFDTGMRYMVLGGEKLKSVRKQNTIVINGYGPTEFTVASSEYRVDPDRVYDNIPIGRPAPNTWQYILDANSVLLPVGIPGELCLSGDQMAKGYWKLEETTAAKFTVNPYADSKDNEYIYHTGDLVTWNADGELECLGRIDTQVKLRGFRIELGEVESVIQKYEGITAAVAEVKEVLGTQHLCAYYTANNEIDIIKLREFLSASLTGYMLPDAYKQMEALPLTPNGKVNRKSLPVPEIVRTSEYVEPEGDVEKGICMVYSEILNTENIGALDNFFEIGGTSMLAIKAIIKIINLGYKIEYGDLFRLKTPRAVANFLTDASVEKTTAVPLEDITSYDYSAIERVLSKNKYSDENCYECDNLDTVLLTGSTGYLGLHILRELISSEAKKIYCMVRKRKDLSLEETLQTMLMYYFSDTFDNMIGTRIIPIEADITDIISLENIRGFGITTVFNCAALVKHYAAGNELDKVNVDGVANLVEFCRKENARLIQVSTISVSGACSQERARSVLFDETSLFVGQHINNKYVLSKFRAERLVLQAVAEGLDAKIMRVGNLMGRDSDGEFQINFNSNAFVNLLKSYKVMEMFPSARLASPAEVSPIDCVARSIVSLSRLPKSVTVLHPYNNYTINMASVIFGMKEYGFKIDFVSEEVFGKRLKELMADEKNNEKVSGLLHYGSGNGELPVTFGNAFTTTLLYKQGIRWPLVSDDYSYKFIEVLDQMRFFD